MYSGLFKHMKHISPPACKLFLFILDHADYRDNSLILNGKYPTQDEMANEISVSLSTVKRSIKELVEHNIIVTEKHRHVPRIYLNPKLCESGMTTKDIHEKFTQNALKINRIDKDRE